eukprot:scaffold3236_cov66-Cylindrotheca_fusiformis.AAC.12
MEHTTSPKTGTMSYACSEDSTGVCSDRSATSDLSSVCFSDVHVREYERIAGDHPDVSDPHRGPPLSLGWKYCECEVMPLDSFEEKRQPRRNQVLEPMNGEMRKNILRYGFQVSENECNLTMKEAKRSKKQREKTNSKGKYGDRIDRMLLAVTRKGR